MVIWEFLQIQVNEALRKRGLIAKSFIEVSRMQRHLAPRLDWFRIVTARHEFKRLVVIYPPEMVIKIIILVYHLTSHHASDQAGFAAQNDNDLAVRVNGSTLSPIWVARVVLDSLTLVGEVTQIRGSYVQSCANGLLKIRYGCHGTDVDDIGLFTSFVFQTYSHWDFFLCSCGIIAERGISDHDFTALFRQIWTDLCSFGGKIWTKVFIETIWLCWIPIHLLYGRFSHRKVTLTVASEMKAFDATIATNLLVCQVYPCLLKALDLAHFLIWVHSINN